MKRTTPAWKIFLAFLSIFLVFFIWKKGLEDSFQRPSVTPSLSFHQQEIALLAQPSVPSSLTPFLTGLDPKSQLVEGLREIPFDQMSERQRLLLAGLDTSWVKRQEALSSVVTTQSLLTFQKVLLDRDDHKGPLNSGFNGLGRIDGDPLLDQIACFALGGNNDQCISSSVSKVMALRLMLSQGVPVIAVLFGIGLILVSGWRFLRGSFAPWSELTPMPLTVLDMVLLVGGGFVILGEVASPILFSPISTSLSSGLNAPLQEAVRVFIGYCGMTVPPLLILRNQLNGLDDSDKPLNGWLQWRLNPWPSAVSNAIRGWAMVMPFVLLISWLTIRLLGDQGGSNPLLEMVLGSRDPLALVLLALTTVVLAPLFEEVIFRGILLPVFARSFGSIIGVVSSALIFGIAHLSVGELPALFVLGIGLAVLRLRTGRLLPSICMHALWNGITFTNLLLLGG